MYVHAFVWMAFSERKSKKIKPSFACSERTQDELKSWRWEIRDMYVNVALRDLCREKWRLNRRDVTCDEERRENA
jgi:hypothetical protein